LEPTPAIMIKHKVELASPEATRSEHNNTPGIIKLGIDVHQHCYVVVMQNGHATPKPPQRFVPPAFLHWVAKLRSQGHEVHAVYEACGFGFGLYRELTKLGVQCVVCCPQKLDEGNKRVKTDGLDARALCLKLERWVQGNKDALAVVRVPGEEEERIRTIHRQREQLIKARKQLEAQGRSLMVNFGIEAASHWWKPRLFARLKKELPAWLIERLEVSQPVIALLDEQIKTLTAQLQGSASTAVPKGMGALTSVVIEREIGDWRRFKNRRQIASYTGLCPSEYSTGNHRVQGCVTKHGNPRLRSNLVELAWRLVRFQPNYPPVAKWRQVLCKGALATGAARKKAIAAVARQLAVDLWRLNTGRMTAAQLGLADNESNQERSEFGGNH
jgi:transposase